MVQKWNERTINVKLWYSNNQIKTVFVEFNDPHSGKKAMEKDIGRTNDGF